jgi:hypothetical protein
LQHLDELRHGEPPHRRRLPAEWKIAHVKFRRAPIPEPGMADSCNRPV